MIQTYSFQDTDLVLLDQQGTKYVLKVRDLPEQEKPRERLVQYGPKNLSISELLAVLFTTGSRKEEVLHMATRLLKEYGERGLLNQTDAQKMSHTLDIPLIKACQLIACFELGRRLFKDSTGPGAYIRTAAQVYEHVADMRLLPKEHLRGLYVNSHFRLVHDEVIAIGSLTANITHPREVFKPALDYGAVGVILVHNHPSGITKPSTEDVDITRQLVEAGTILGIHLLDHIIVTKTGFASVPVEYH